MKIAAPESVQQAGGWGTVVSGLLAGKVPAWCGYAGLVIGLFMALLWMPFMHIPPGMVEGVGHGLLIMLGSLAVIGISAKQKHTSDMFVQSEAEKRVAPDSGLPATSTVPAIQTAIDKLSAPGALELQTAVAGAIAAKRESGEVKIVPPEAAHS